jgi:single-strand DNA-binding protein
MAGSVNKMILVGNLGNDPELRETPGGSKVCEFSIATNEKWKDKDGETQEHTEWTTIIVWGAQAEPCKKYLKKGRPVYVEGKKRTRSWEKDGVKHYKTECIASDVQFLGSKEDGGGSSSRRDDDAF